MIEQLLKKNCSTLFLLKPVVGIDLGVLGEFGIINSYLRDKDRDDLDGDLLFVLFKPEDWEFFEMFLAEQSSGNHSFLEDYDYHDGYVVLVYRIPSVLKDDFEKFKLGKYSEFSKLLKNSYEKGVKIGGTYLPTFQWRVFQKAASFRKELEEFLGEQLTKDMELWQIPSLEGKEILDIDLIRKQYEPNSKRGIEYTTEESSTESSSED